MRILLINHEYPPIGGGAANATEHIARALASLGHQPVVLTAAYDALPQRSAANGVTVIRVPAWRARRDRSSLFEMATYVASAAVALPGVLRKEKPDAAIVFFSMPCGPLGLLACWWGRVPYVISLRGGDVPGTESRLGLVYSLLAPVRRLVLRKAVAVVANSTGLKSLSEAADPVAVAVIPNGVDTGFFRPAGTRAERAFTFLFVGRFQAQKNLPFLLEAVRSLRREVAVPFRLVLVGDGPLLPELQRLSTAAALDSMVTWHGWCGKKQLLAHYQAADCFLNPSLYEGMPNTVLEAMACGLPVLASKVPGNDAVVAPGETGILFGIDNLQEFVGAMHRVLAEPGVAANMGAAGRRRALVEFSWDNTAMRYLGILGVSGSA